VQELSIVTHGCNLFDDKVFVLCETWCYYAEPRSRFLTPTRPFSEILLGLQMPLSLCSCGATGRC